jgi:hypothetical protein
MHRTILALALALAAGGARSSERRETKPITAPGLAVADPSLAKTAAPPTTRRLEDVLCPDAVDDPTWVEQSSGKKTKDCAWVAKGNKPSRLTDEGKNPRCFKEDVNGVKARDACAATCDYCPTGAGANGCFDSTSWQWTSSKGFTHTCASVARKPRRGCGKFSDDDVPAYQACKFSCGTCRDCPADGPTAKPTELGSCLQTCESDIGAAFVHCDSEIPFILWPNSR